MEDQRSEEYIPLACMAIAAHSLVVPTGGPAVGRGYTGVGERLNRARRLSTVIWEFSVNPSHTVNG